MRLDLATDLLNSEREICSGVRLDESSATVRRGGDLAAESEPWDPPAAETAGKEEALWRLGGWKKSIRVLVLGVDEAISVRFRLQST